MVELRFGPSAGHVTILALLTEFALVNIIFRVALVTGLFRLAVFLVFQVAGGAFHQFMLAVQHKVGESMIKLVLVKPDYPGIASLVIAMAGFTFLPSCILVFAMKTPLVNYIVGHRFVVMTAEAQFFLGCIA